MTNKPFFKIIKNDLFLFLMNFHQQIYYVFEEGD